MGLKDTIKSFLNRLTKDDDLDDALDRRMYPSGTSAGMSNPKSGAGLHLNDDNSLEAVAGKTSLCLDGASGVSSISGASVVMLAERIVQKANPNGFIFNYGKLNPAWLPTRFEAYSAAALPESMSLRRSPLVLKPAALSRPLMASDGTPVLLTQLLEPKPLFTPTKASDYLAEQLRDILHKK